MPPIYDGHTPLDCACAAAHSVRARQCERQLASSQTGADGRKLDTHVHRVSLPTMDGRPCRAWQGGLGPVAAGGQTSAAEAVKRRTRSEREARQL